jgi:hypothetical protein
MIKVKIDVDNDLLSQLQQELAKFGAGSMPATARAMKSSADLARQIWQDFATGGHLSGVEDLENPSLGYARSIRIQPNGPFDYEVYSEAKIAKRIEEGTDDLDMKTTHPYGPRSRISKKGVPYVIIPLRWKTPGAVGIRNVMPINVYSIVKKFEKMKTLVDADKSNTKTPNAQTPSRMVGRAQYNEGYDRLNGMDFAGTVEDKTMMSGMVRTTDTTGKDRAGGYFTFRIISANSPADSWKRKGMPARHVTQAVAKAAEEEIAGLVSGAIRVDLGL